MLMQHMTEEQEIESGAPRDVNGDDHFSDKEFVTFDTLSGASHAILSALTELGCHGADVVGLHISSGSKRIATILALWNLGASFVPLDPSYPLGRLRQIVALSKPALILRDSACNVSDLKALLHQLEYKGNLTCIDKYAFNTGASTQVPLQTTFPPSHVACILFTSGSTGNPKGVVLEHYSIQNRLEWNWEAFPFERSDICCQKTTFNFVDFLWEAFGPLLKNIPLVVIPQTLVLDTSSFHAKLDSASITRLVAVPSLLKMLLSSGLSLPEHIKYLHCSGELLTMGLAKNILANSSPELILLNLYGSTELTGDVTCLPLTGATTLPKYNSIGSAICNAVLYVHDQNIGGIIQSKILDPVAGELLVSGACIAKGYYCNAAETSSRFLHGGSPADGHDQRFFRTGDIVRRRDGANIEIVGRADDQVKVNGNRVELGAIENCIRELGPWVTDAVVRKCNFGDLEALDAYVSLARPNFAEGLPSESIIKRWVSYHQPQYASLHRIFVVDRWPLLPNGKIDKKAMTKTQWPELSSLRDPDGGTDVYVLPENSESKHLTSLLGNSSNGYWQVNQIWGVLIWKIFRARLARNSTGQPEAFLPPDLTLFVNDTDNFAHKDVFEIEVGTLKPDHVESNDSVISCISEVCGRKMEPTVRISSLGLKSLDILTICARLSSSIGLEVPLQTLKNATTVQDFMDAIDNLAENVSSSDDRERIGTWDLLEAIAPAALTSRFVDVWDWCGRPTWRDMMYGVHNASGGLESCRKRDMEWIMEIYMSKEQIVPAREVYYQSMDKIGRVPTNVTRKQVTYSDDIGYSDPFFQNPRNLSIADRVKSVWRIQAMDRWAYGQHIFPYNILFTILYHVSWRLYYRVVVFRHHFAFALTLALIKYDEIMCCVVALACCAYLFCKIDTLALSTVVTARFLQPTNHPLFIVSTLLFPWLNPLVLMCADIISRCCFVPAPFEWNFPALAFFVSSLSFTGRLLSGVDFLPSLMLTPTYLHRFACNDKQFGFPFNMVGVERLGGDNKTLVVSFTSMWAGYLFHTTCMGVPVHFCDYLFAHSVDVDALFVHDGAPRSFFHGCNGSKEISLDAALSKYCASYRKIVFVGYSGGAIGCVKYQALSTRTLALAPAVKFPTNASLNTLSKLSFPGILDAVGRNHKSLTVIYGKHNGDDHDTAMQIKAVNQDTNIVTVETSSHMILGYFDMQTVLMKFIDDGSVDV